MNIIDPERVQCRARLLASLNGDASVARAIGMMAAALAGGGKVLAFGNGGSATQAAHFAAELVNKFHFRRPALPALALASDLANLTSIANDEGFGEVFARQLEALGRSGDLALGLTTSGHSANVLRGLAKAKELGLQTVALAGKWEAELRAVDVDVLVAVDADDTPTVQEMHLFVLHAMAERIEQELFGGKHD